MNCLEINDLIRQGGLLGSTPTILAAWRLGAELEFWSQNGRQWYERPYTAHPPGKLDYYRLKPKT